MPVPHGGNVSLPSHSPRSPRPLPALGLGPQYLPVAIDGAFAFVGHGGGSGAGPCDSSPLRADGGTEVVAVVVGVVVRVARPGPVPAQAESPSSKTSTTPTPARA